MVDQRMRILSKSKLLAFRQCPKRLWLEIHRPELREDSAATQANFDVGHRVGEIARRLYDPKGKGQLIDLQAEGFDAAFIRTRELLDSSQPIFEAGFSAEGALAFADVMLPARRAGKKAWRMVEVKSSTSIKDYHRDDAAVQAFVAVSAGVPLLSIALAHIDNGWVYPGGNDFQGLLVEIDLTDEVLGREAEVRSWIAEAQSIVRKRTEPKMATGRHCGQPYACGFRDYCESQQTQTEYPVNWLPNIQTKALKALTEIEGVTDMREVPDELLSQIQRRVKSHTLANKTYFDARGAADDLAGGALPAYFIDFETIQFAVPIWEGTRPYQKISFQFSVHRLARTGKLQHQSFLDLSGKNPSRAFAESLIDACGGKGPVFVYSASFETARIRELADRFPRLRKALLAIKERVVDLLPIAEQRYYHPSQQGSWSLKRVLPAVTPELCYGVLDGVQNGGMAMDVYLEAMSPDTTPARIARIEQELLDYCKLDTYALVRIWQVFASRRDLVL